MNICFCRRYNRWIFSKRIDGMLYKKRFMTRSEAELYRDYFFITYYNGVQAKIDKDLLF